jgi:hypothetical protein
VVTPVKVGPFETGGDTSISPPLRARVFPSDERCTIRVAPVKVGFGVFNFPEDTTAVRLTGCSSAKPGRRGRGPPIVVSRASLMGDFLAFLRLTGDSPKNIGTRAGP